MDIQAFVQHQERDRKPFLLNDPEVDGLVSAERNGRKLNCGYFGI